MRRCGAVRRARPCVGRCAPARDASRRRERLNGGHRVKVIKVRATTAEWQSAYPWHFGGSIPSIGPVLGLDRLAGGGPFGLDPLRLVIEGPRRTRTWSSPVRQATASRRSSRRCCGTSSAHSATGSSPPTSGVPGDRRRAGCAGARPAPRRADSDQPVAGPRRPPRVLRRARLAVSQPVAGEPGASGVDGRRAGAAIGGARRLARCAARHARRGV